MSCPDKHAKTVVSELGGTCISSLIQALSTEKLIPSAEDFLPHWYDFANYIENDSDRMVPFENYMIQMANEKMLSDDRLTNSIYNWLTDSQFLMRTSWKREFGDEPIPQKLTPMEIMLLANYYVQYAKDEYKNYVGKEKRKTKSQIRYEEQEAEEQEKKLEKKKKELTDIQVNHIVSNALANIGEDGYLRIDEKLPLSEFAKVKHLLESLGAIWTSGKVQGYIFNEKTKAYFQEYLKSGKLPDLNPLDYYPTPKEIVSQLSKIINPKNKKRILEPSAGDGAIAVSLRNKNPNVDVIELDDNRRSMLREQGFNVIGDDFLAYNGANKYDAIYMNPPFTGAEKHIEKAFSLLEEGGEMVAVLPSSVEFAKEFENVRNMPGFRIEKLDGGAFKESGTNVNTCIVYIRK